MLGFSGLGLDPWEPWTEKLGFCPSVNWLEFTIWNAGMHPHGRQTLSGGLRPIDEIDVNPAKAIFLQGWIIISLQ
jgi:hypothetical protein